MAEAYWNGKLVAKSSDTIVVEGNHYFPPNSVQTEFLRESDHQSTCPWKGLASYYDLVVDGKVNDNAAWYYPEPKQAAQNITGYVAFWKGVEVRD